MKKIIYAIGCLFILFLVEQVFMMPYVLKTLIKLPLFTIVPFLALKDYPLKLGSKSIKWIALISILVFVVILIAYLLLQSFLDISTIKSDIENRMAISKTMFLFACFYTVFINSFIEEIFFRGYLFQSMNYKHTLISATLFAIYHISIFRSWFSLPMMGLILFGLIVGGLIFNILVKKTESILSSWLVHMSADLIIVLIGLFIFI